ncbi:DUF2167 domain-containing protein [Fulvivirga ulvae]|uniref:DUF2167 domain-containing protein n=1 Tax=Fulvivirga ulvae TaxID=2904245 RepID=UPI001F263E69|nr:DUF2167 domain-containing protein [Fulvivirga ulvae]UII29571.1 DUF2167 domain-containing protein [Fulvivirga ulvae]
MKHRHFFLGIVLFVLAIPATAQEDTVGIDSTYLAEIIQFYKEAYAKDSLLNYQHGFIELGEGIASLNLGESFKYLDPEEANKIIVEAWGNPPQETLGMIFPDSVNPYLPEGWGVILAYDAEGHIEDDDANDIDYNEMLVEMKTLAVESSKQRKEQGYDGYAVVGWAENPYYDKESKKLYWAKELAFDGSDINTLNYDIRVLGRSGYLRLNAVAGMDQLEMVKPAMQDLLAKVEFAEGHTYFDFDPDVDEVAAYGVGALVAGKIAAKAGILKTLGIFLVKFWKFLLMGFVGIGAFVRKMWTGKEKRELSEDS